MIITFSGLTSRWTIDFECMYCRALATCQTEGEGEGAAKAARARQKASTQHAPNTTQQSQSMRRVRLRCCLRLFTVPITLGGFDIGGGGGASGSNGCPFLQPKKEAGASSIAGATVRRNCPRALALFSEQTHHNSSDTFTFPPESTSCGTSESVTRQHPPCARGTDRPLEVALLTSCRTLLLTKHTTHTFTKLTYFHFH